MKPCRIHIVGPNEDLQLSVKRPYELLNLECLGLGWNWSGNQNNPKNLHNFLKNVLGYDIPYESLQSVEVYKGPGNSASRDWDKRWDSGIISFFICASGGGGGGGQTQPVTGAGGGGGSGGASTQLTFLAGSVPDSLTMSLGLGGTAGAVDTNGGAGGATIIFEPRSGLQIFTTGASNGGIRGTGGSGGGGAPGSPTATVWTAMAIGTPRLTAGAGGANGSATANGSNASAGVTTGGGGGAGITGGVAGNGGNATGALGMASTTGGAGSIVGNGTDGSNGQTWWGDRNSGFAGPLSQGGGGGGGASVSGNAGNGGMGSYGCGGGGGGAGVGSGGTGGQGGFGFLIVCSIKG